MPRKRAPVCVYKQGHTCVEMNNNYKYILSLSLSLSLSLESSLSTTCKRANQPSVGLWNENTNSAGWAAKL